MFHGLPIFSHPPKQAHRRGPLRIASAERRVKPPAETREFFRIIDDQADRMIGVIADLLDAGRIEAGTLSVAPEPSEVAALVDQARGTFISGGGRHAVGIDLPPVLADRQRIVQVLNNLLANAARHAPDTAAIRIAAARDGEHVAVSVSDEGRGILDHVLEKIKLPNADKSGCPLWPLTRGPWHLLALLGRRRSLRHVVFGKKKIERFGEKVLDLPSSFGLNKAQGRFNLRGEIGADIDLPCPAHRQRLRLRLPLYRRRGVSRRHFSGSLALDGFQYAWSRHFSHF